MPTSVPQSPAKNYPVAPGYSARVLSFPMRASMPWARNQAIKSWIYDATMKDVSCRTKQAFPCAMTIASSLRREIEQVTRGDGRTRGGHVKDNAAIRPRE